ncbi:G-protein coupled receptor Mth2 [Gryllus bimaculatus]|nr:G-protein coupled receptor Mth2 [Gryllus bimaculatus]
MAVGAVALVGQWKGRGDGRFGGGGGGRNRIDSIALSPPGSAAVAKESVHAADRGLYATCQKMPSHADRFAEKLFNTDSLCIDKCCPQGQVVNLINETATCVRNTSQRLPYRVVDKLDTPVEYKFPDGYFCEEGNLKKGSSKYVRGASLRSTDLDRVYRLFTEEVKCVDHVNALSVYFFLVAANVWVNVLTLDIADGLRRPLHERAVGDTGRWKRTIIFSIYAWGFAAVLTSFAAHAEFNPQSTLPKPTYLETRTCRFEECGYLGRHATLTYYYGPIGTLFLVNLAIYAYLAIRLDQLNADSEMVDEQAMNDPAPSHRSGTIFFRLLMMMGTIEWVVEFTMWGLRGKFRTTEYLEKYKRFATIEDEHQSQVS